MTRPALDFAWRSDTGRVRARNEDAIAVYEEQGLIVVADGIGGASAGHIASQMATEIIGGRLLRKSSSRVDPRRSQLLIEAAVEEANGAILERAKRDEGCARMGTTVVVGVFGDRWMSYTHVGDSRLYRLRESRLEQLTNDHSLIQEVVDLGFFPDLGEARRYGINGNVLTRAVGSSSRVAATTASTDLRDGDIYLFCTDGLTGSVNDDALQFVLAAVPMETRLDVVANALVHLAYQGGASDNVTLALARVRRAGDDDDEQGGSAGGDTIASAPV